MEMVEKSWILENVVEKSITNKETFFIPNEIERNNQKINDMVRLHFVLKNPSENEPRAERMWVKIFETIENKIKQYKGHLTNVPVYIKGLKIGDIIEFDADNIAQTIIKKDNPYWVDSYEKKALVSKKYFEDNSTIRFLYREEPNNEEDSGWRMFTGLEDDEYANNTENIKVINVGYLLDKDPSLLEPLKNGYGTVFERLEKNKEWIKVEDWIKEE